MRLKALVAVLLLAGSVGSAQAQALPAAVTGMSEAVGGILQYVAQARGFAANDPRIYQMLYSVGTEAAEIGAGAEVGLLVGGTAPAWGSVLGMAALAVGAGVAVSVGSDALVKWAVSNNASGPLTVTAPGQPSTTNLVIQPSGTSNTVTYLITNSINTPFTVVTQINASQYNSETYFSTTAFQNPDGSFYIGHAGPYTVNGTSYYLWNSAVTSTTNPCPSGYSVSGTSCVGQSSGTTTTQNQTLDQAMAALTTAQQTEAINDQTMAMMLNYLWQQAAAQPGYSGLPYSASNPISSGDVDTYWNQNPSAEPQVGWLGTAVPSGGFAPSTSPTTYTPASTSTTPGTTNPAQSASEVNLGPDPGTPAPSLEQTPTANDILAPILGLLPDLRAFSMPAHNAVCPQPSFTFLGQQYTFTEQCTLAEQYRSVLYAACVVMFTLAAMFIVLTA